MRKFDEPMIAQEFNDALEELGVSVYASANVLGISLRQAQRYSSGEEPVAWRTANHVRLLLFTIGDLKRRRKQLIEQIKPLEKGAKSHLQRKAGSNKSSAGRGKAPARPM